MVCQGVRILLDEKCKDTIEPFNPLMRDKIMIAEPYSVCMLCQQFILLKHNLQNFLPIKIRNIIDQKQFYIEKRIQGCDNVQIINTIH